NKIARGSGPANAIKAILNTSSESPQLRHWAMKLAKIRGVLSPAEMVALAKDADPEIRADAIWLLGVYGAKREAAEARIQTIGQQLRELKGDVATVNDLAIVDRLKDTVESAFQATNEVLLAGLEDGDPLVRRRTCESLVRAGVNPPPHAIWPLLGDR